MSELYSFNQEDLLKILKVAGYLAASTLITFLLSLIPQLNVPANWAWMLPIVNILLVAAKNFFTNSSGQFGKAENNN
jgi:hypothetical protein